MMTALLLSVLEALINQRHGRLRVCDGAVFLFWRYRAQVVVSVAAPIEERAQQTTGLHVDPLLFDCDVTESGDHTSVFGPRFAETVENRLGRVERSVVRAADGLGREPRSAEHVGGFDFVTATPAEALRRQRFAHRVAAELAERKAVAGSVGPPCRVHNLRHTHGSWLIADGGHPKAIQTRLGHGSISVTTNRYGHLMDGLDDQIAVRLDARAEAAAPPARPSPRTMGPSTSKRAGTLDMQGFLARSPDRI